MDITEIIKLLEIRKKEMGIGIMRDKVIHLLVRLKADKGVYPWELSDLRAMCCKDNGIMATPRFTFPIWDCNLDSITLDKDYERPDHL